MEYTQNKVFYHIHQILPGTRPWRKGETYFFGDAKNYFIRFYDNAYYNDEVPLEAILKDYLLFARETIFEEVRQKHFPQMPSRQRCIWLIPDSTNAEERLKYWIKQKSANKETFQILKLSCSGKMHLANQKHLDLVVGKFDIYRANAFRYWSGCNVTDNSVDVECTFEGFINVLDVIPFPHE